MPSANSQICPPTCLKTKRGRLGFTLLEVLAALLLVAVVLPIAMHGLSLATQGGSYARSAALATNLAQSKLAEIVAEESWAQGDAQGDFDATWGTDAKRFRWTLQVDDWQDGMVKQVRVTVTWVQRNREESVSLVTLTIPEAI